MHSYPAFRNGCASVSVKTLPLTALASAAAALFAAAADGETRRLESPLASDLSAPGVVHTLQAPKSAAPALPQSDFWGGTYTAASGEPVTVYASTTYPVDDARAQQW